MSTSPVSSSSSYQLGSLGGSQQITGLASGLNTDQIISEEMSIYNQPVVALQHQQSGLTATNSALSKIQSELQTVANDAQALGSPTLFATSQAVTSSDPTRVTASSSTGAGVGGYQVSVTALANSAQRTFTYASPTTADTIQIDGQSVTIPAGQAIGDFVNSINSNSKLDVYAAATNSGTVVLSNRATGNSGGPYIQVTDTATPKALTEQTTLAQPGQNASYSINGGTPQSSPSNTVANAIAGVTLTLTGVTTTSGPVTVNVAPPAPSSSNISSALNQFIKDYNSTITDIQTQLAQQPSNTDPTKGVLYNDPGLSGLLSSMRSAMYKAGSSLPAGLATMMDIGVSTGATSGTGSISASALAGDLQLNSSTLTSQLTANPAGVQAVLQSWSTSFSSLVNSEAGAGGSISAHMSGDSSEISQLGNQITAMQSALTDKQNALVQQFAQLESALSTNQSTASWLTSQLASLPGA